MATGTHGPWAEEEDPPQRHRNSDSPHIVRLHRASTLASSNSEASIGLVRPATSARGVSQRPPAAMPRRIPWRPAASAWTAAAPVRLANIRSPIEGGRGSAALDVADARDADIEADVGGLGRQLPGQLSAPARHSLRHHDQRVRLPPPVGVAHRLGHRARGRGHLRDRHRLGAARQSGHEGQVATVTAHHLHQESAVMGRGGHLQPIDRLERDVDGRGGADGHVAADEIVVDGGCDAHHPHTPCPQRVRPRLGAVATNHDQRLDPGRSQPLHRGELAWGGSADPDTGRCPASSPRAG
jgi:hypothetical protein